ncbi:hypothetical protein B0T24DRAFT_323163 [Lasiosphaeria ovina]|uniref:NmrA-like domain-containing protein n=1 Tax=Lasiosphaeria ovina TaxID=92902 RepID=A0AAE0K7F3_9PEZI|nr:hypothetical protein B0T24DRAFT_323163 [Lasiosphaeria ovina]
MATVVVFGATGVQGGSVVNRLLKNPKYKIRAVTRNPDGEAGKKLASQGVEVVAGDANDKASVEAAFKGAEAAFFIAAYWPSVATLGLIGAGEEELVQYQNVAHVAAASPTLKHLVLSTLPPADKSSGGRLKVPHYDFKAYAVDWIQRTLPELWAKTTEVWPGFYDSNFAAFAMVKPLYLAAADAYLIPMPAKKSSILPVVGSVETNLGVVVEAILTTGAPTFSKLLVLVTDYVAAGDVPAYFSRATGKRAVFLEYSDADIITMFGIHGDEYAAAMRWAAEFPVWDDPKVVADRTRLLTLEQVGLSKADLVSFDAGLALIKDKLVQ